MKKRLRMGSFLKSILFPAMIFFVAGNIFSQGDIVRLDSRSLNLNGDLNKGFTTSFAVADTVYFINRYSIIGAQRKFYFFSTGKELDSMTFMKSKKIKKLDNERILSFVIKNNGLTLLTNAGIYQFVKNGSKWKFLFSTENKYKFDFLFPLGEYCLLEICYPFHKEDAKHQNLWGKYDPSTGEISPLFTPKIDNSKFGCFVNSWVSVNNGVIAQASTYDYRIHFYNSDFQLVDSIMINDPEVSVISGEETKDIDLDSKDGIAEFMKHDAMHYSRLRKVFFLDSTHLIILIKFKSDEPDKENRLRMDVWEKVQGKWSLDKTVYADGSYNKGSVYNDTVFSLGGLYQNMQTLFVSNRTISRVFCPYYPTKIQTESFDRKKDIDPYLNPNKQMTYGIEKFTFLFD